jgi:hypothetical protein
MDKPGLLHVRVVEISFDEWRVNVTIVDSLMPGMHGPSSKLVQNRTSWELLSFSADYWQTHYVPWRLFLDPRVIRECAELATQANRRGSMIDWNDGTKVFSEYYLKGVGGYRK